MLSTLTHVDDEVLRAIEEEKALRRTREVFLLFGLGSQFDHLIVQALAKEGVFCLVADPGKVTAEMVTRIAPKGIVLSGGPVAVHTDPPPFDHCIFDLGIPTLGICLGFQLWAQHRGAPVRAGAKREFGRHLLAIHAPSSLLFRGIDVAPVVLQSHGDAIEANGHLEVLASTEHAPVAAGQCGHLWGVQFHPEVTDTDCGPQIFTNFCRAICGAQDRFPAQDAGAEKIRTIREMVEDRKVLLALSGGSDSSVVAHLLRHALPDPQVRALYIRGIDRPDDETHVREFFTGPGWFKLEVVDGTQRFLAALAGKTGMHEKRLAMRAVYREILEEEAAAFGADFIAQGTLYTDLVESGGGYSTGARKAVIKAHHNTGLKLTCPELTPLDDCVKDSARDIGRAIGVPEALLTRHPFPGPGLVVRIEGEVTAVKLAVARAADRIWIEALRRAGLYESVWQAGAVVTQSVTTCTKGDDAASGWVVALWAVSSVNGFTAQAIEFPPGFLSGVARTITNEIREVGAVVYRISDKPPATIEWG